jgi:hypothetical protein
VDTRAKIIPYREVSSVIGCHKWIAVVGAFDPLTATQARRLADLKRTGRKLLAIVVEGESALLTAEARAALVAALREVDAVSVANDLANLAANPAVEIVMDSEEEKQRTNEFIEFVLRRQDSSSEAGQGT